MKLLCRFCQREVGETTLSQGDVIDIRCDTCENSYGNYKEMSEKFYSNTGLPSKEFKEMLAQADYKQDDFEKLLVVKIAEVDQLKREQLEEDSQVDKL